MHGVARNEDLLALAGTGRRERKPERLWAVALVAVMINFALERDFNGVVVDDNAMNRAAGQFACLCVPDAGSDIGPLVLGPLSAQLFGDNLLDIIGPDAGSRTCLATPQLCLADVITVTVLPSHRISR